MTSTIDAEQAQEFQVGANPRLSVDNVAGSIRVESGEDHVIRVIATKDGRSHACDNTNIEMSQNGDHVHVRTTGNNSGFLGSMRGMCSVHYRISVPRGCPVAVKSVSAGIAVIGTQAPVTVSAVSSDAQLEDVAGSCTVSTVSGDVDAQRIAGMLTMRTTSGRTRILDSQLTGLVAHSVSGDVSATTPLAPGKEYYSKSVSGDLTLIVPGDTGATVQMNTVSGRVTSDLPAQIIKSGRRHWQGRIGSGAAHVELKSVSGDLHIVASSAPVVQEQEPSVAALNPERTAQISDILRLLEQGEITVEDAMTRIKALG